MRAARPHIKKNRRRFTVGVPHTFHLEGTDFDTVTQAHLTEDASSGIIWDPQLVTTFSVRSATVLEFTSTPRPVPPPPSKSAPGPAAVAPSRGTGTLTITVTNPTGTSPGYTDDTLYDP